MAKIEFKKSLFKDSFILDPENDIQVKTAEQCFNLVGMMVIAIDLNYNITMVNKSAIDLLGISNDQEVIGRNWIDIINKTNDTENILSVYDKLLAKKQILNEKLVYKLQRSSREIFYVESKHIPISESSSKIIGILIIGKDVTELIKYQLILKQNISLYKTLGDNLPGIDMYMFNSDLEFILAEGKELQRQGLKKLNFKGKSVYEIKNKQLKNIFVPLCRSALEGSEIATEFSVKDIYYNIWVIPVRDEKNIVIAGVIIIQNITKEKSDSELLYKAKKEAEEANASKSQFLANMAHEIRTPLNAILGFAEQLMKTNLDNLQSDYINILDKSANHLLKLVDDLLVLSKIEAGELALNNAVFKINNLVKEIYETLEYKAKEKRINLRYNINSSTEAFLKGDATRLKQILINILNNAIKFTESGYVELNVYEIKSTKKTVTIRFDIIDTGIGIHEDKISRIFDQYEQIDLGITRKFGGTGLGLTICKRLIDLQKGKISVKSEPGIGSQFTVILSYKKVEKFNDIIEHKDELNQNMLAGLKVLIVDDDSVNRFLGEIVLNNLNCNVDTSINGTEALEKVKKTNYDLILLDIHMPDINGIEVANIIRNEYKNKKVKILAFTAAVLKRDIESFKKTGINDYISKPFKELELYRKICNVLDLKGTNVLNEKKANLKDKKQNTIKSYDLKDLIEITNGDQTFINKMLLRFVENAEEGMNNMQIKLKQNEIKEIGEIAHKLIPSFKHLNMFQVEENLKNLKDLCFNNSDKKTIKSYLENLNKSTSAIIRELKKEIK